MLKLKLRLKSLEYGNAGRNINTFQGGSTSQSVASYGGAPAAVPPPPPPPAAGPGMVYQPYG